jgi:hypothetical protein
MGCWDDCFFEKPAERDRHPDLVYLFDCIAERRIAREKAKCGVLYTRWSSVMGTRADGENIKAQSRGLWWY